MGTRIKNVHLLNEENSVRRDVYIEGTRIMSFSIQALAAQYLAKHGREGLAMLNTIPEYIDQEVAERKLKFLGVKIDHLTPEQKKYIASWNE